MKKYSADHFGIALKQLRQDKNLSQEKLAIESNLDHSHISLLERNLKTPRLDTIVALSMGLGVKASELFIQMEKLAEMEDEF